MRSKSQEIFPKNHVYPTSKSAMICFFLTSFQNLESVDITLSTGNLSLARLDDTAIHHYLTGTAISLLAGICYLNTRSSSYLADLLISHRLYGLSIYCRLTEVWALKRRQLKFKQRVRDEVQVNKCLQKNKVSKKDSTPDA